MTSVFRADTPPPSSPAVHEALEPAVLIMAAGVGNRLWPLSTAARAKQFCALLHDDETLLQATFKRALLLTRCELIFMTVAPGMEALAYAQCPQIPRANILTVLAGTDTLPGVAYASARVEREAPGRVLTLLAADNFVGDDTLFVGSCRDMVQAAGTGAHLVSLGIRPTYAADIYGYMHIGSACELAPASHWGLAYVEKPPVDVAAQLVAGGEHLWNSGIFAWRPEAFFAALASLGPDVSDIVARLRAAAQAGDDADAVAVLAELPNTSLDQGLMEHVRTRHDTQLPWHVFVAGPFAWDDVGSYAALKAHFPSDARGNAQRGRVTLEHCNGCLVINASTATLKVVGLSDCVVVAGARGEILLASFAQVGLLRARLKMPLYNGTTHLGAAVHQSARDAQHNAADAPVLFAASTFCEVSGAEGREVALLGIDNTAVALGGDALVIEKRQARKTEAQSDAPRDARAALTLLDGPEEVAQAVAQQLVADLTEALSQTLRPAVVFSSGATPVGVYRLLATQYASALPWERIRLFQMDAYVGLDERDCAHFHLMLQQVLVGPLGLSARYLSGTESSEQMQAYAQEIRDTGGLDVVLHGIGRNGHLGFNEPHAPWDAPSGLVALAAETQQDFKKAHPHAPRVPQRGVTLGLDVLNAARRIRVMALGEAKRTALVSGIAHTPSVASPLSSLQGHADVRYYADRKAWLSGYSK